MKIPAISDIFEASSFSSLARQFNVFTTNIGFNNMGAQVVERVLIPSGTSVKIPHSLKITPKYRIIIRQIEGGAIIDGDDLWTDKYISLKNTGGSDAIVSVLIVKE